MTDRLTQTAPPLIWLQVSSDPPDRNNSFPDDPLDYEVTWSSIPGMSAEVEYVRADKVEKLRALLREVIACDDLTGWCGPDASPLYDRIDAELGNA